MEVVGKRVSSSDQENSFGGSRLIWPTYTCIWQFSTPSDCILPHSGFWGRNEEFVGEMSWWLWLQSLLANSVMILFSFGGNYNYDYDATMTVDTIFNQWMLDAGCWMLEAVEKKPLEGFYDDCYNLWRNLVLIKFRNNATISKCFTWKS